MDYDAISTIATIHDLLVLGGHFQIFEQRYVFFFPAVTSPHQLHILRSIPVSVYAFLPGLPFLHRLYFFTLLYVL